MVDRDSSSADEDDTGVGKGSDEVESVETDLAGCKCQKVGFAGVGPSVTVTDMARYRNIIVFIIITHSC